MPSPASTAALTGRWVRRALLGAFLLTALMLAAGYLLTEWRFRQVYPVALVDLPVPKDAATIASGKHLATLRGCNDCHGAELQGMVFIEEGYDRIVAPNLALKAQQYSARELERVIRHGIKPDGRSVWMMPSSSFYHVSDADLGAIIAYLRSVVPSFEVLPVTRIGPVARYRLLTGMWPLEAEVIDQQAPRIPSDGDTNSVVRGRYLARTICAECHGGELRGLPDPTEPSPDLIIVRAYTSADFVRLMRTGTALGNRRLGLMTDVALSRFGHFTEIEIADLYAYLSRLEASGER